MGRRAELLDAEMAATLAKLQTTVLCWDFYNMRAGNSSRAVLRKVPQRFTSFQARCFGAWARSVACRP